MYVYVYFSQVYIWVPIEYNDYHNKMIIFIYERINLLRYC
jgi:hypothetical protein